MKKRISALLLAVAMAFPAPVSAELLQAGESEEAVLLETGDISAAEVQYSLQSPEDVLPDAGSEDLSSGGNEAALAGTNEDLLTGGAEAFSAGDRADTDTPDMDDTLKNDTTTVIYRLRDSGSGNLTIYWRYKADVTGFQIRFSTDSTYARNTKTASYTGRNHTTRTGLSVGSTYYVSVRTYMTNNGKRYYSHWSGTKSIKLTRTLPGTSFTSVTGKTKAISTVWKENASVDGYQLMFADNASFSKAKTASVKAGRKSFTKTGLNRSKTWYVRIRTYKYADNGEKYFSAWSDAVRVAP